MSACAYIRACVILLSVALLTACNEGFDYTEHLPAEPTTGEVVIRASQPFLSRTEMGEVGNGSVGSAQTIRWSDGDRILVWAEHAASGNYAIDGVPFTLATYNAEYTSADFMATVGEMAEAIYHYTALYPLPATQNGTTVSYTIPSAQSGAYDPTLDVMTATTTGNALSPSDGFHTDVEWKQPTLAFNHLFHLIRIRIPEGKNNLGLPIKRLEITFPQEVVGTVSFDALDPVNTQSWSNLSNKITIELTDDQLIDAGKGYVWLHIKPTEIRGEISFVVYNEAGVISDEIATVVERTMAAQHITPIALTIPESPFAPFTYVDIREIANNLGEDWQTMTLSGYSFLVPFSSTLVSSIQFTPNDKKSYTVAISADPATMGGKSIPLQYESEHCLFNDPVVLPTTLATKVYNMIHKTVPYLLEENFSGMTGSFENGTVHKTSDAGEYDAIDLSQYGLNDWYGARVGGGAGQNLRICSRIEMGLWIVNRNTGRVDTPALSKLKPNANATIRVDYDYAGDRYEATGSGGYPVYSAGTSTSRVQQGNNTIENVVVNSVVLAIDGPNKNGTYYGNTPHHTSFNAGSCGNTTRVCWFVTNNRSTGFAGNGMYWLYIDNIQVQIAN